MKRYAIIVSAFLGAAAASYAEPPAALSAEQEHGVKAALLFNFAKFVEWPPAAFSDPRAPLTILVIGQDPFGGILDEALKDRLVNGHPFAVQRLPDVASATAVLASPTTQVHIAFIKMPRHDDEAGILAALERRPVLTIGDEAAFADHGGMIALTPSGANVRFTINNGAARDAGLAISSRLLKLAAEVRDATEPVAARERVP